MRIQRSTRPRHIACLWSSGRASPRLRLPSDNILSAVVDCHAEFIWFAIAIPIPLTGKARYAQQREAGESIEGVVIELRLTAVRRLTQPLMHAVLAKAFHRELVPTEAELARRENRTYE